MAELIEAPEPFFPDEEGDDNDIEYDWEQASSNFVFLSFILPLGVFILASVLVVVKHAFLD